MLDKLVEIKNNLRLADPEYLELLNLVYVLLAAWGAVLIIRRLSQAKKTSGSRYPFLGRGLRFCLAILLLVLPLFIVAAGRPYLVADSLSVKKGAIEAVFAVDDSISMWVKDISPGKSRLEVAVAEAAGAYANGILKEGDKAALVVFGKTSLKKVRLSSDLDRFFSEVARIRQPETLIGDDHHFDSDLPVVLHDIYNFLDSQDRLAVYRERFGENPPLDFDWKKFGWRPSKKSNRIVLFFGDGDYRLARYDEARKKSLDTALAEFRRRGLKIYCIGIGTRSGAPLTGSLRNYRLGKDYTDEFRAELASEGVTRLDVSALNSLSSRTNGNFTVIQTSSSTAEGFLNHVIDSNRDAVLEVGTGEANEELWQDCLYLALFFLALAVIFC